MDWSAVTWADPEDHYSCLALHWKVEEDLEVCAAVPLLGRGTPLAGVLIAVPSGFIEQSELDAAAEADYPGALGPHTEVMTSLVSRVGRPLASQAWSGAL